MATTTPKYDSCRAAVDLDKSNFDAWAALLSAVEVESLDLIRSTFDEFLSRFPLMYGYWEKYAAAERRAGESAGTPEAMGTAIAAATAVYERAAAAAPFCADMWLSYARHATKYLTAHRSVVENVFSRAMKHVKYDPRSVDIWKELATFRESLDGAVAKLRVFEQAIQVPMPYAEQFLQEYTKLAATVPVDVLASAEERAVVESSIAEYASKTPAEKETAMRAAVVAARQAQYAAGNVERASRNPFERTLAARWYFHVTDVDMAQQGTWRRYLDWAEKQQLDKARSVFERCIVVCAAYPEFWTRFSDFEKNSGNNPESIAVLQRSIKFLKPEQATAPTVKLADMLERAERIDEAREVYSKLQSSSSTPLLEAVMNHCNFERRHGSAEAAVNVLQRALSAASGDAVPYLSVQMARVELRLKGEAAARAAYKSAIKGAEASLDFWRAYIAFETNAEGEEGNTDILKRVGALFRQALGISDHDLTENERAPPPSKMSVADQAELWDQFVTFMENHTMTLTDCDYAKKQHKEWKTGAGAAVASLKRPRPGAVVPGGSSAILKKPRMGAAPQPMYPGYYPPQPAAAAYGAMYAGYGAGAGAAAGAYGYPQPGAYGGAYAQRR